MNKLDLKKINKIYKKNSVKSEKTLEKLKINSRILAKNSKGGSLWLLKIAPKTLKKRAWLRVSEGAKNKLTLQLTMR